MSADELEALALAAGREAQAAQAENARLAAELESARERLGRVADELAEALRVGAGLAQAYRCKEELVRDDARRMYGSRSESGVPDAGGGEADPGLLACEFFESSAEPEATGEGAFSGMGEAELATLPEEDRAAAERARKAQAVGEESDAMLAEWAAATTRAAREGVERRAREAGVPLAERLASLEQAWRVAMPDGTLAECASEEDAAWPRAAAGADPALRSFMSFDSRLEVEHVPARCVLVHVLRPRYKAKAEAASDAEAKAGVAASLAGSPGLRVCGLGGGDGGGGDGRRRLRDVFVSTVRDPLLQGSYLTPSLAAAIVVALVVAAVPVCRQLAAPALFGISSIPASTAGGWATLLHRRRLRHLMPLIRRELVGNAYLHADETPIRTLRAGPGASGRPYMWLFSTPAGAERAVRFFSWAPGRAGRHAVEALEGFVGTLMTDAYAGYNLLAGVVHAFCLIHARRKFFEAAGTSTLGSQSSWAARIVGVFDRIFEVERGLAGLGAAERLARRVERMGPLVRWIDEMCDAASSDPAVPASGKLARAVGYWKNNRTELTAFLRDGEVPLHNMVAEGMARVVGVYRRGSLFCGSPAGAEARACLLTIVETARANGLDPQSYVEFVLEGMRGAGPEPDEALLESLLPWSEGAREACAPAAGRRDGPHSLVGGGIAA